MSPCSRLLIALSLGLTACQSAPVPNGTAVKPPAQQDLNLKKGDAAQPPDIGWISKVGSLPANSFAVIGKNFTGTTSVRINDDEVSFNVSNDGLLTISTTDSDHIDREEIDGYLTVTTPAGSSEYPKRPVISSVSAMSGAIGDKIVITGTNLGGTKQVYFGATTASYTVDSDSRLTVTVPGGATDSQLRVETNAASASTNSNFDVTNKVWFVNDDVSGDTKNGASWSTAFSDLQQALSAAAAGDEIWVAQGKYLPTSTSNRALSFNLKSNLKLYGGFAGTEKDLSARNWKTNTTTLSGDLDGNDNYTDNSSADLANNSYHIVTSSNNIANVVLDGFKIQGGNADGNEGDANGAGLYLKRTFPLTLNNLLLMNNKASNKGGGAYLEYDTFTSTGIVATDNSAPNGGGLYLRASTVTLQNGLVTRNSATTQGGGIFNDSSALTLRHYTFFANSSPDGDGLKVFSSTGTGKNLLLWGDAAVTSGSFSLSGLVTSAEDPFVNSSDPDGADDVWMTADDGLRLSDSAATVINQGVSTDLSTDILGNPRVGNPDPGAYEKQ